MAYLRGKLLEKRQKLMAEIEGELGARRARGMFGWLPGDSGDVASDSSNEEMSFRIAELGCGKLAEIDAALARMEGGNYGACEECGKRIPLLRLRAIPTALLCLACQQRREHRPQRFPQRPTNDWSRVRDDQEEEPEELHALSSRVECEEYDHPD